MAANKPGTKPKKKATARGRAAEKLDSRKQGGDTRVPGSIKEISQRRFPGERPLTGEDRSANRPGRKKQEHDGPVHRARRDDDHPVNETPHKNPRMGRKPSRRKS